MVSRPKGKQVFYGNAPTRLGWKRICLRTTDRQTADAKQRMLYDLKHRERWEVLDALDAKLFTLNQLYEAHQHDAVDALLVRAADVDVAPYLDGWVKRMASSRMVPQTRATYRTQVGTLITGPTLRSTLTPRRVTAWLDALPVSNATRRKYHIAANSFFKYLRLVGVLPVNPLQDVPAPPSGKARVMAMPLRQTQRMLDAAHEPYRSYFALLYGTGIEVTVGIGLRREHVDLARQEVFAPGTKTHNRERIVRVATWAWPYIETLCKGKLPSAPLFPEIKALAVARHEVSRQHRLLAAKLGLTGYQLRDSRHAWAVRAARAGTPVEIIARQLGHVDATMVLKVYGRFLPSQHERDKWEAIAALQDEAEARESDGR